MNYEEAKRQLDDSGVKIGDVYHTGANSDRKGYGLTFNLLTDISIEKINNESNSEDFDVILTFRYETNPPILMPLKEYLHYLKYSQG